MEYLSALVFYPIPLLFLIWFLRRKTNPAPPDSTQPSLSIRAKVIAKFKSA